MTLLATLETVLGLALVIASPFAGQKLIRLWDAFDTSQRQERAQVQFVDVLLGFFVLVGLVVTYPVYEEFINNIASNADPLSTLILQLIYPAFVLGLMLSVGVSARRGGDLP